ncbi:uncharacterized protein FIBRA_07574 [Fibroporia radiculosa]|uniref:mRNA-decapping enzyme C-terminal domain-containing protein n=1 Tax=Fibroporia radiculosa TaxID=599839 RepID=J4GV90_9APHY|nr:uncharacterized protein FIBRA_07574 [Fibroporia radiculosa]CCM05360.1 predicted protein [Fibroporia radiculosa]
MTPRHRSTSNASSNISHSPYAQRTQSPAQSKRQMGLTPAVYENNMKVLLRREPSIRSILDQFSHVCVYHHNGSKWEKQGYEGSMFLFEKQTYPPYGFFILNRMGTDDYIRPIHPEDDMDVLGDYLMYRYYPKFTQTRIAMGIPYPIPAEQRSALNAELLRQMTPEEVAASRTSSTKEWRGTSITIGLWMFATDSREPLKDPRLHSYIKQGKSYPEEFRYGPGKPPPSNSHLRTASRASVSRQLDESDIMQTSQATSYSPTLRGVSGVQTHAPPAPSSASGSELDKLFAKLLPSSPTPAPAEMQPAVSKTVDGLFASVGVAQPQPAPRGLALLDTIFASASTSSVSSSYALPAVQSSSLSNRLEEIEIVSPKPTSSALPQILNQDVISSLLGFGSSSRASSAAPSSSGSRRSGLNRYEGDNEYSEGEVASGSDYSASSTVLDTDADPAVLAAGSSSGLPLFAVQPAAPNGSTIRSGKDVRRVEGDVTPRATMRGIDPFSPNLQPQRSHHLAPVPSLRSANGIAHTALVGQISTTPLAEPVGRPRVLVPFETDSDLWPYPRAPLDDRTSDHNDGDVVELDFADTRALSDPTIFSHRLKEKQNKANGKKKTRRERAADRENEKEEIERGWDDPVRGQELSAGPTSSAVPPAVMMNGKGKQPMRHASPMNGHAVNGSNVQPAVVKDATISAMISQPERLAKDIPRNDFVRELLTLIHTNKDFVDTLWHEYTERIN